MPLTCFSIDTTVVLEGEMDSVQILMEIEKEFVMKGSKHRNFDLDKNNYNFTKEILNTSAEMFILESLSKVLV